jgi:co-chaperonin GroES (HSP10)
MIHPVGDRVLVRRESISKTSGGIVLPTAVTANEGTVLAVGDGILQNGVRQGSLVSPGDRITWHSGHVTVPTDENLVLVPETAILTVVCDCRETCSCKPRTACER